jgi:hypothetical protein
MTEKRWAAFRGGTQVQFGYGTEAEIRLYLARLNARFAGQRSYPHWSDHDVRAEEQERLARGGIHSRRSIARRVVTLRFDGRPLPRRVFEGSPEKRWAGVK